MAPIKRSHPPQETSSPSQITTHHLRGGLSAHHRVHETSVPHNTDGPLLFLVSNVAAGSGRWWAGPAAKSLRQSLLLGAAFPLQSHRDWVASTMFTATRRLVT